MAQTDHQSSSLLPKSLNQTQSQSVPCMLYPAATCMAGKELWDRKEVRQEKSDTEASSRAVLLRSSRIPDMPQNGANVEVQGERTSCSRLHQAHHYHKCQQKEDHPVFMQPQPQQSPANSPEPSSIQYLWSPGQAAVLTADHHQKGKPPSLQVIYEVFKSYGGYLETAQNKQSPRGECLAGSPDDYILKSPRRQLATRIAPSFQ